MPLRKEKYITSLYKDRHGYDTEWVRLVYSRDIAAGKQVIQAQRSFPVSQYKSRERAREAARRWRNRQAKSLGIDLMLSQRRPRVITKRSSSGIAGVWLAFSRRRTGECYPEWKCSISNPGKIVKIRSFSCRRYGYKEAFIRAIRQRAKARGVQIPSRVMLPALNDRQAMEFAKADIPVPQVGYVFWNRG